MAEEGTERYRTLSVIVPVYNERNTLPEVVRRMRRAEVPLQVEVVIVDDGSTDGSDKILAAIEDSTVQYVRHDRNRGKGAAIRTGLSRARGDLVLIQDADLEYNPTEWPRLLEPILAGEAQVVYGARFIQERLSPRFCLESRLLALATNLLYDTSLRDMLTGYKVFDRRVLDSIVLESDGFEFEPEVTAKTLRRGHRIHEVPISYVSRRRAEGRKYTWKDGVLVLWTLVRYRWWRR